MNMAPPTNWTAMISDILRDWVVTKKSEHAALALKFIGIQHREREVDPVFTVAHESMVEMAVATMEYLQLIHVRCLTDDFDTNFDFVCGFDGSYTAWLMARFILQNHIDEYRRQIASARVHLAAIEDEYDAEIKGTDAEFFARQFIRDQPPLLFMNQKWNYGFWRRLYAEEKRKERYDESREENSSESV